MKVLLHSGRNIRSNHQEYLDFSGTSYLNLPYEPEFQSLFLEGMSYYGLSNGKSPFSNPQLDIYNQLEELLAGYYHFEDALLFQTGFAASRSLVEYFIEKNYSIRYSRISHPAIKVQHVPSDRFVYASDVIDPVSLRTFKDCNLSHTKHALILDASHAFGVLDEELRNLHDRYDEILLCGSLNKGLGINAGVILCSSRRKRELMQLHAYSTSGCPSPAACYALFKAFETGFIEKQQAKLYRNILFFPQHSAYRMIENFPVLTFQNQSEEYFQKFLDNNIFIWRNDYPQNSGSAINRAVIHSGFEKQDLEEILEIV